MMNDERLEELAIDADDTARLDALSATITAEQECEV